MERRSNYRQTIWMIIASILMGAVLSTGAIAQPLVTSDVPGVAMKSNR